MAWISKPAVVKCLDLRSIVRYVRVSIGLCPPRHGALAAASSLVQPAAVDVPEEAAPVASYDETTLPLSTMASLWGDQVPPSPRKRQHHPARITCFSSAEHASMDQTGLLRDRTRYLQLGFLGAQPASTSNGAVQTRSRSSHQPSSPSEGFHSPLWLSTPCALRQSGLAKPRNGQ